MAGPAMEAQSVPTAAVPFDRMKRGLDEFAEPQSIVDSWAENDATEQFRGELYDMRVMDAQALMASAERVAEEHERRAQRARKVKAEVQAFLLDVADVPQARVEYASEAKMAGPSRG